MSLQNLNVEEFQDLIEVPMDLARSIVKQLRESASSGTAKGSKGLSIWDIITYVDMLLGYKGTSCKYLIVASFLTFARDVLRCKCSAQRRKKNRLKITRRRTRNSSSMNRIFNTF